MLKIAFKSGSLGSEQEVMYQTDMDGAVVISTMMPLLLFNLFYVLFHGLF